MPAIEATIFIGLSRNEQLLISPFEFTPCGKKDCYFCYMMTPVKRPKEHPRQPKTNLLSPRWTVRELDLLKDRIDMPTHDIIISGILPGRRESAINQMKTVLRKRYSINVRPRLRANGALASF